MGSGTGGAAALGVALAFNSVGTESDPNSATARVTASSVDTDDLSINATTAQSIGSVVIAASVAVGVGSSSGFGLAASGVFAENEIAADAVATLENIAADSITATDIAVNAQDVSTIRSTAGAAAVAVGVGSTTGAAASIGVGLARNTIETQVKASVVDSTLTGTQVVGTQTVPKVGNIDVNASESASIDAVAFAASVAVGSGGSVGVGVSGAGADANNRILTQTQAWVENSTLTISGDVDLDALSNAAIQATVVAVSVAVGAGGSVGGGLAVGASLARNEIGYVSNDITADHVTGGSSAITVLPNETVQIADGPGAGAVYRYLGTAAQTFSTIDVNRSEVWERIDLTESASGTLAHFSGTTITAGGNICLLYTSPSPRD